MHDTAAARQAGRAILLVEGQESDSVEHVTGLKRACKTAVDAVCDSANGGE